MGKSVKKYGAPMGMGVKEDKKEEAEREAQEAAQIARHKEEEEKKRAEKQKKLEEEESRRRRGGRYGKRGMPIGEYLGETQPGYRKTILGG